MICRKICFYLKNHQSKVTKWVPPKQEQVRILHHNLKNITKRNFKWNYLNINLLWVPVTILQSIRFKISQQYLWKNLLSVQNMILHPASLPLLNIIQQMIGEFHHVQHPQQDTTQPCLTIMIKLNNLHHQCQKMKNNSYQQNINIEVQ